jgi:hypothetical protein
VIFLSIPYSTLANGNVDYFTVERFSVLTGNFSPSGRLFDFDSDGDLDVMDARHTFPVTPGPLTILRNNGQGVFSDATATVLGNQTVQTFVPRHFVVADFNRDGRNDFFIADHGPDAPPFPGGQSRILIQTADGKLRDETATRLPIKNAFTHHVSAADIEGDGDIDLYLANIFCGGCGQGPELYINDGTGLFTANTSRLPTFVTTSQRKYTASAFMDVNGDARPDLILGAHPGTQPNEGGLRDTILLNDGNGNFNAAPEASLPPRAGGTSWGTVAIEPADFDGDNKLDLLLSLTPQGYNAARLQLLLNNGNGTFREASDRIPQSFPTGPNNWIIWAFPADFNNDGKMDFVTSSFGSLRLSLYLNAGQARFIDKSDLIREQNLFIALPDDIDGDGDIDIFGIKGNGFYAVLRNQRPFVITSNRFDFDGDGKADQAVFRETDRVWYLLGSSSGFTATQFGISTDRITPADFDGDGKTDIAVFRDGVWYLQRSQLGFAALQFGIAGDVPVPADYDGDGKADFAVYRSGVWYILGSQAGFYGFQFGISTDKAVPADFDGDGKTDAAVYRDGVWYMLRSQLGFTAVQFGIASDKPVVGDYDGDGKADQAVYRAGVWYLLQSTAGFTAAQFGIASDIPVAADYDGDVKTDVAVYRDGVWYSLRSQQGFTAVQFGIANDKPIPAAFMP